MRYDSLPAFLESPAVRALFAQLYGPGDDSFTAQKTRYLALAAQFQKRYGDAEIRLFSAPGRSEIGGNHTDHNHGKVLAASIQLDCIAVVAQTSDNNITIHDESYGEDYCIDISGGLAPVSGEKGSAALVRGIAAAFQNSGTGGAAGPATLALGGFSACVESQVLPGSGVSSSAAFEMLITGVINGLYHNGTLPVEKLAAMGQFAENNYWNKGSGLLDQMASGAGGLVSIDFENPAAPKLEKIPFDFSAQNTALILVNTGGNHANLSGEYTAIPNEMKSVAAFFGKDVLRSITADDIAGNLPALRAQCGDRAVLRAIHFIEENIRVDKEVQALKENNFDDFLTLIQESGDSSYRFLQNVALAGADQTRQNIPVCLALTELFFRKRGINAASRQAPRRAACRVHGGGFAGVIQVFLPLDEAPAYTAWMENALGYTGKGQSPVFVMSIRPKGVVEIGGMCGSFTLKTKATIR
jgi:galactokinase